MYNIYACVLNVVCLCIIVKNCQSTEIRNSSYVRLPRDLQGKGCVLPQYPKFGKWSVFEETSTFSSGQIVNHRTILQVTCEDNYKLDGDAIILCRHGKWTAPIGDCLRTCPSRYSNAIMTVTCRNNDRRLENCENPTDGTKAKFQCADFYEDRSLDRNPVHVCYNGKWNHKLPECTPICGQKSVDDPTLIVNGKNVTKGHYPWQVALYNATNKEQLCGGSLLSQRVILTAAHCVTDLETGQLHSKELYMVGVGKFFREFDHHEDQISAQFSTIHEMHVPRQYKGDTQNYFGDIAILITKTTFALSPRVQPVCIDWALSRFPITINTKKVTSGIVVGWGYTVEHKNPSNFLKELEVPLINDQECSKRINGDYTRFLTDDKFCAGFSYAGTSVCKGDSGGGLVVQHGSRYYVIGIVSLAPLAPTQEGGCDSQNYGLYTNVQYYIDSFILDKETLARPVTGDANCDNDPTCNQQPPRPTTTTTTPSPVTEAPKGTCILPEHKSSGRWSIFGVSTALSPGAAVSQGTVLQISCNNGLTISGSKNSICENGVWSPPLGYCSRGCPPLRSTQTTRITCTFQDKEMNDCSNPPDGTIAKQSCAPFYEDLQLAKNPIRVCRNGSWDTSRSDCVPICGLKSVTPQPLIVNGSPVKKGEYPWQVAIYKGQKKQFICGGALIGPKLILTAAHCVTNWKGQMQNKNSYVVAVGKFYRKFNERSDDQSQVSELQDIYIPVEYTGVSTNYLADLAVLVTKNAFTLSQRVQPVCIDWGLKYIKDLNNSTGYVAGWGYTLPNSRPSETLKYLEIPVIPEETCLKGLPDDFRVFVTQSTFCGGYLNRNLSLCAGDAGGAFVTKHDGRYYATGIVSTAPTSPEGGCNSNQYSVYTKIADYVNFILEKDAKAKASASSDCLNGDDCEKSTKKPESESDIPRTTCTLPEHPAFGRWSIYGVSSDTYRPRHAVATGTVLQINCDNSYKLEGDAIILCEKGKWSSPLGQCLKTCPPVTSSHTLKAKCIYNNKDLTNCTEPVEGTRVKYECAQFYEDPQLAQNPIHVCRDGAWSNSRPQCIPACGLKSVTPQILIVNGKKAKSNYPWHVGIYRGEKKDFICSGVLIDRQVILTAAQCVADYSGNAQSKDQFTVAVGKNYRKFDDSKENARRVQSSQLLDILVHPQYKGTMKPGSSIAILITKKRFTLTSTVQPACVDWGLTHEKEFQSNSLSGFVSGWGFTSVGSNPADELQELEVPIVSRGQCQAELPETFLNFFTYDKFCAGYLNKGKSICNGDSGGGLVVKFNGRYYVIGIVDSAPRSEYGGCDTEQYGVYTKVTTHIENFIEEKTRSYRSNH